MTKPMPRVLLMSVWLLTGIALSDFSHSDRVMAQNSKPEKLIWTGQSGGFAIQWTTADIKAETSGKSGQVLFSVIPLAQKGFKEFLAAVKDPAAGVEVDQCSYERDFSILSVVGSLMSFQDVYYSFCRGWAHPAVETRFTAIDLAKPGEIAYANTDGFPPITIDLVKGGKVVKLTEMFSQAEILQALLADSIIKETLQSVATVQYPKTLQELSTLLENQPLEVGECLYRLPEDFLTRFAFHHVEQDKVAIRIGLPPAAEACRTQHAQLGILLPIPASLKPPLALAASGQEGFLMQDQKKIAGDQTTTVAFTPGKSIQD